MKTNLNLLHKDLFPRPDPLSLGRMLLLLGVVVLLLATAAGWQQWQLHKQQQLLQQVQARRDKQLKRIDGLSRKLEQRQSDPDLKARLQQLRQKQQQWQPVVDYLRNWQAQTPQSAAVLTALARQDGPRIWLTGISWGPQTPHLRLQGATTQPAALPAYLKRLAQEQVFAGLAFATVKLTAEKAAEDDIAADRSVWRFELATRRQGGD